MIEGYKSVNEIAKEWGLTARQVQNLCANGEIENAGDIGSSWAIPANAENRLIVEWKVETIETGEREKRIMSLETKELLNKLLNENDISAFWLITKTNL